MVYPLQLFNNWITWNTQSSDTMLILSRILDYIVAMGVRGVFVLENTRVHIMLLADSVNNAEFSEQISSRLKEHPIGIIYYDIKKFELLEKKYGHRTCSHILLSLQQMIIDMQRSGSSGVFSYRMIGDDTFLFLTVPEQSAKDQTVYLHQAAEQLRLELQQRLNDMLAFQNDEIELYMGAALLNPTLERSFETIFYNAVKQVILDAKSGADMEYRLLQAEFYEILEDRSIQMHYQPIVSLVSGEVYAYEALSRGPKDSYFASPFNMFQFAEKENSLYALEKTARELAIQGFFSLGPRQKLFINMNANVINDPNFTAGQTIKLLEQMKVSPQDVVFEITERNSIEDFSTATKALENYRKQGYRIAIDDAGAGYSSLQAIAELRPDYIKIDRSLIHNIHQDKMKEILLESLVLLAQKINAAIIAEGIETYEELNAVIRLGVQFGQGFLLGRPQPELISVSQDVRAHILNEKSRKSDSSGIGIMVGTIVHLVKTFSEDVQVSEVTHYFNRFEVEQGVVIVRGDKPVGIVMRDKLFQILASQYGVSLFWNKSITKVMDGYPLIVEENALVEDVSRLAMTRAHNRIYDLVVVTRQGSLIGIVTIQSILDTMSNAVMKYARDANPLTGLPGNQRIQREMMMRIALKQPFAILYIDIDHFKWFNDTFGFQQGDRVIQYLANILQQAVLHRREEEDLVGHIGGDDFIVITNHPNVSELSAEIIANFDRGIVSFYDEQKMTDVLCDINEKICRVKDRYGNEVLANGISISIALLEFSSKKTELLTPEEITRRLGELKKLAKSSLGSSFVREMF